MIDELFILSLGGAKARCFRSNTLYLIFSLFGQSEIRLSVARRGHRLRLVLGPFMPSSNGVASVRDIFNLVAPGLIRSGKVGSGHHHEVSRHLRVNIAKYWHHAWGVE